MPRQTRKTETAKPEPTTAPPLTKLEILVSLLSRPEGADIAEMMAATGWLSHSVRGALAGALKKRGLQIESAKADGRRVYRLATERGQ